MEWDSITVDHHAYGVLTPNGWRQVVNHQGGCTYENCGQHMAYLVPDADQSKRVIDAAVEAVQRVQD